MSHWANCTCLSVVYAGDVVHATCDEEDPIWRPGQVVDLRSHRPAHVLDSPCLLVLKTLLEVGLGALVLSRDPKEDVPVVAGAGERLSWRAVRNGVAMN